MVPTETPPLWARFFTTEEYALFVSLIESEMQRRDLSYEMEEGVVEVQLPRRAPTSFGLLNLAQLCHQVDEETWSDVMSHHFDGVFAARADTDDLDEQSYEAVEELIKLRLYPADYGTDSGVELLSFPLSQDIDVALVFDLPTAVTTVHPEHVQKWDLPLADVFAKALDNVRRDEVAEIGEMHFSDGSQVTALTGESFFTATHALLLEERFEIPEHGAIIAIPNRHLVLFHAIEDIRVKTAINALATAAHRRHEEGPGSISPYIFWWRRLHDNERELVLFPSHVEDDQVTVAIPDIFREEVLELLVH